MDQLTKTWIGLAGAGFILVSAFVWMRHDLRGWSPNDPYNPNTVVSPIRQDGASFAIRECLPGSIDPWGSPTAQEYSGSATLIVLSCRSRSSAVPILAGYGAAAAALFAALAVRGRRKRRA